MIRHQLHEPSGLLRPAALGLPGDLGDARRGAGANGQDRLLPDAAGPRDGREARDRRCELIVMGTHGRRGLQRLALGRDAEVVLHESPVPVLLVRAPEPTLS